MLKRTLIILSLLIVNAYAGEATLEKAQHRLPPVIYSIDIPKTIKANQTYDFKWTVMGYHDDYNIIINVYDKSGKKIGSKQVSSYDETEGEYSWKTIKSTKYFYETEMSLDFSGSQELIIRFFASPPNDYVNTDYLSCLVPGGSGYKAGDTTGRKILIDGVTKNIIAGKCEPIKIAKIYSKNKIKTSVFFKPPSPVCVEPTNYNPTIASSYAKKYYNTPYTGLNRNKFSDFDGDVPGGNCTNFVSQCLLAGISGHNSNLDVFNSRNIYFDKGNKIGQNSWYFVDYNNRAPAWTGANWLYDYVKTQANNPTYDGLHFKYITHDTLHRPLDYRAVDVGDIIFADWTGDGTINHTMLVTDTSIWRSGYNEIQVTYQSSNKLNRGLGDINEEYHKKVLFYVYRPTGFSMGE